MNNDNSIPELISVYLPESIFTFFRDCEKEVKQSIQSSVN